MDNDTIILNVSECESESEKKKESAKKIISSRVHDLKNKANFSEIMKLKRKIAQQNKYSRMQHLIFIFQDLCNYLNIAFQKCGKEIRKQYSSEKLQ